MASTVLRACGGKKMAASIDSIEVIEGSEIEEPTSEASASGSTVAPAVSLLDRLKAPKPSDLSRKRKVAIFESTSR